MVMLAAAQSRIVLLGGGACNRTSACLDPKEDFSMVRSRKFLSAGALGVAALALVAASSGVTGASFGDAETGNIQGSFAKVDVVTSNTLFTWTNMQPGVPNSASVDFWNRGSVPQDFYLVFYNATALSALNDLGTYGEAHLSINGVEKFASTNLTDHWPDGSAGKEGVPLTHPLPKQVLLASNVAVGAGNTFEFTFKYDVRIGSGTQGGVGAFNTYPAKNREGVVTQTTTIETDGTGDGLPFKVVAVQVGQQP